MIRLAVPALLLLASCAAASAHGQDDVEKALAGYAPGAPLRCLRRDQFDSIRPYKGTILYVAGRAQLWRNDVVGDCAGLQRGDVILSKPLGGRYCEGDVIETHAPAGGGISGSCSLGKFTPWKRR